jgi:hypothetical protein
LTTLERNGSLEVLLVFLQHIKSNIGSQGSANIDCLASWFKIVFRQNLLDCFSTRFEGEQFVHQTAMTWKVREDALVALLLFQNAGVGHKHCSASANLMAKHKGNAI